MKKTIQTAFFFALSLLFVQCANSNKTANSDTTNEPKEAMANSNSTEKSDGLWGLESTTAKGFEVKPGTTLKITATQFQLNALCNSISGGLKINQNQLSFLQTGMISTRKGCLDNYEVDLKKLLFQVNQFEQKGDALVFTTDTKVQLVWKKYDALSRLVAKEWSVVSAMDEGLTFSADNPALTMKFTKEGQISGFAGCNQFSGSFKIEGEKITISKVALTRMACMPEAMKVENNFIQNINKSVFTIEEFANQISFRDEKGSTTFVLE